MGMGGRDVAGQAGGRAGGMGVTATPLCYVSKGQSYEQKQDKATTNALTDG